MRGFILTTLWLVATLTNEVSPAQESYGMPFSYGNVYNQPPSYSYNRGYGKPPPYESYGGYHYSRPPPPPLVDRDVCDLDASVLLVVSSRRHRHHDGNHLNRAHRVRCSVIASYDEESCNVCCQHAARRDKSLMNNQFVGFLAVTKDFEHWKDEDHHDDRDEDRPEDIPEEHSEDQDEDDQSNENDNMRRKRSSDYEDNKVDTVKLPEKVFMPSPYYRNVKCVCCAPKRPYHPQPIYPAHPVYPPYSSGSQQPSNYPSPPSTPSPPYPPTPSPPSPPVYHSDSQQSQGSPSPPGIAPKDEPY
uniref:Extensin-like n=1 Tax=Angiostrongylus cantonensis TaxID=6313 RepID=A0A158PA35_ANGCA